MWSELEAKLETVGAREITLEVIKAFRNGDKRLAENLRGS
jgi:hypothetical protein